MGSIWMVRRSATDRKLSGLCGGIAEQWGIDPLLVRIGGVVLAVSGGIGLVLYAAGWLLIPEQGAERSKLEELVGPKIANLPRGLWIAIIAVACLISISVFGSLLPFGLGPALILAGIWYFGYYRGRKPNTPPRQPPADSDPTAPPIGPPTSQAPDSPFVQAAEAWRRRVAEASSGTDEASGQPRQPVPPGRPVPPGQPIPPGQTQGHPSYRWSAADNTSEPSGAVGPQPMPPRTDYQQPPWAATQADDQRARADFFSNPDPIGLYRAEPPVPRPPVPVPARPGDRPSARRLRLVGLVALGLVLAGLGIADALGATITATIYVAAALLVVGLTLVAATWLGRARGILPVGILLAIALAMVTAVGAAGQMEDWARDTRVYTEASALPTAPITKDFGSLELDLSQVELTKDTTLTANVDIGRLQVTVPDNVNLNIRYEVANGTVVVLDQREQNGPDLGDRVQVNAARPNAPTLTLDLTIDQGYLEVTR